MTRDPTKQQTGVRRLAGVRARGSGDAFERWLERFIFAPLLTRGKLLRFDRLNPDTRSVWDAVRRQVVFSPVARSGADFVLMLPMGRYGIVEAKSSGDPRFYRADLPDHQVAHLDQAVAAGGAAYLALQFRQPALTAYMVPWQSVPWATARTSPSITASDVGPWVLRSWIDAARIFDGGQP
jgi:penicillin-binding protein-related factor A (putative recombinase)